MPSLLARIRNWLGWRRGRRGGVAALLAVQGAARCVAAVRVCQELSRSGDPEPIVTAWEEIEMPLLQALPDCPPEVKPDLISALDACAGACTRRDVAKRIMALRNSLLG